MKKGIVAILSALLITATAYADTTIFIDNATPGKVQFSAASAGTVGSCSAESYEGCKIITTFDKGSSITLSALKESSSSLGAEQRASIPTATLSIPPTLGAPDKTIKFDIVSSGLDLVNHDHGRMQEHTSMHFIYDGSSFKPAGAAAD